MRGLLLAVALAGCGPSPLPPPRILEVTPSSVAASDAIPISVKLDAVLPFHVDYRVPSAQIDNSVTLTIGARQLDNPGIAGGAVTAFVPSVFAPGNYDVWIRLGDGREATLPAGFTVSAGSWPDDYQFVQQIADQIAGQPFVVALRALRAGVTDTTFHGTLSLSVNHGAVTPGDTAPFDSGLVAQQVVIPAPDNGVFLTATDAAGRWVSSGPFKVTQ